MTDSEKKTEAAAAGPAEETVPPAAESGSETGSETAPAADRADAGARTEDAGVAGDTPAAEHAAPETTAQDDVSTDAPGAEDQAAPSATVTEAGIEELMAGLADVTAGDEAAALAAAEAAAEAEQLREERDALKDKLMRALAEAENVRRRAERDRKDAETYGGTKLARDLLSVYDNIERAMANADGALRENHAAFLEGVELTGRELLNAFAKHKIEKTEPQKGERFDPNLHQAMFEAPVPGAEPGTIIEVMQPGFTIAGRLLRPALVGVARAA